MSRFRVKLFNVRLVLAVRPSSVTNNLREKEVLYHFDCEMKASLQSLSHSQNDDELANNLP